MEFIHQLSPSGRIGDYLTGNLAEPWTSFRAAVAFVKRSGTRHIAPALAAFARTSAVEIIAGIDHGGTSAEGLQDLLDAVFPAGRVIVFHNRLPVTFHPKIYLFKTAHTADILVGSGNLTEGGLFTNYEAAVRISLDMAEPRDAAVLRSVEQRLDAWADLSTGTARVLDNLLLARLTVAGLSIGTGTGTSRGGAVRPLVPDYPQVRLPTSCRSSRSPSMVSTWMFAARSAAGSVPRRACAGRQHPQ